MLTKLLSAFRGMILNDRDHFSFEEKFAGINLDRVRNFSVIIALANTLLAALPNLVFYFSLAEKQSQSDAAFLLIQLSVTLFMVLFYTATQKITSESKLKYQQFTVNLFIFVVLLHAFGLSASTYVQGSTGLSIFLIVSCALMVGLHLPSKKLLIFMGGANLLYLLGMYQIFGDATLLHTHLVLHLLFGTIFFLLSRSVTELKIRDLNSLERIELQSAELKSSNKMLRMTEHTLNSINRNMHQGIFRLEKERGFIYANDYFAQMLGYASATELITDAAVEFISPRDLEKISRKVNEQGFMEGIELEINRKNKEKFWVQVSCSVRRDENSGTLLYEGSATDISHKKKALQEALENAAKLEQAEKIAHAGFYEINVSNGQFTYSSGLSAILETTVKSPLSLKQHLEFVHPDDRERVRKTLLEGISMSLEFSLEYRIITKKGTLKYLNSRSGLIRDEQGNKIKILGTVQDVTAIRQSQEALEQSEAYIKAAFNNTRYGIFILDPGLKLIGFNEESARRIKSWRHIDLHKGLDVRKDLFLPQTLQIMEPLLQDSLEGRQRLLELNVMEGTTQETWVELYISPVKDREENIIGLILIGSDITDRKQSEGLLENLSLVASHTDNAVLISDHKHRIEWVNEAFVKSTGFKPEEVVNRFPKDFLLSEKTDTVVLDRLNDCLRKGKSFTDELLVKDKGGEERWIHLAVNPVFNETGAVVKFVTVSTDLSKIKAYEQQLQTAKERAEHLAESKENFLSTVSHELRTPLNAVIGLTHHLLQNKPREDQEEDLNILKFSAENLLSLINDILDLSKIEAGKVKIEHAAFNLKEIINSLKQSFQNQAESKGLTFKVFVNDNVPFALFGDSIRLIQILANLLSNAVKFTSKGSVHMYLQARLLPNGHCELEVKVEDTGRGIAPDKLELIFDKFEQASQDTAGNQGGTGLGLSITKQLIELQGGCISVSSTPAKGSTFTFNIPYKIAQLHDLQRPERLQKQAAEIDVSHLQLLLVEDNKINQAVAGKFLKNWNISFSIAENGEEAVQKARTSYFDLILMDLQMPVMNGYDATSQIRKLDDFDYSKTPIIAITAAGASAGIEQKIMDAGMTSMMFKPFKPEDLLDKIRLHCPVKENNTGDAPKVNEQDSAKSLASPSIDLSQIASLAGDDSGFIQDLIKLYIEQFNVLHAQALQSLEKEDAQELRHIFHKMKPAIAMLRQMKMGQLSQQVHGMLHQENIDFAYIKKHTLSFLEEMEKVKNQLQEELKGNNFVLH